MAIKDSIVNLKKGLRTTLTNVPALIDTLVRGLDGVAEAAEEEKAYSTDEREVGTWIDGSTIYEKVFYNANKWTLAPNDVTTITGVDISYVAQIIDMDCSDGYTYWGFLASARADNGNMRLINLRPSSTTVSQIILKYTKASENRAPENNNKNDGDEEKNDNER